jgi:hypothetical protein
MRGETAIQGSSRFPVGLGKGALSAQRTIQRVHRAGGIGGGGNNDGGCWGYTSGASTRSGSSTLRGGTDQACQSQASLAIVWVCAAARGSADARPG